MAQFLRDLKLKELSLVDRPACAQAQVTIFKRDNPALSEQIVKRYIDPSEGAKPFSEFLQNCVESDRYYELQREIGPLISSLDDSLRSIAGDKDLTTEQKHSMMRASADEFLAAAKQKWPEVEEVINKGLSKGDLNMKNAEQLQAEVTDLQKQLEAANKSAAVVDGLKKQLEDLQKKLDAIEAEKAEALAKAAMTDAEKEYMDGLTDEEAKRRFRAMKPEERQRELKKRDESDEVLKIEGQEIRKSQVGEAQFKVMKAQAERIEKAEKAVAEERERRLETEYKKRAADELPHLPGDEVTKVAVLKGLDGMPDTARTALAEMLKAGNEAMKGAFTKMGHGGNGKSGGKDPAAFEKRITEIAVRDHVGRAEAMTKARIEYPDEFAAYQQQAA